MKELFVIIALMGASSEEEVKQSVIQSQVPSTIITEQVHIDTGMIGSPYHKTQCWTTNIYHSDGSIQPKVQCQ